MKIAIIGAGITGLSLAKKLLENEHEVEVFEKATVEIAEIPTVLCVDGTLDVELDATVTGGTAPYTYLWEGPGYFEVTEDALLMGVTSDDSGTYTLMVTDANGCEDVEEYEY